MKKHVVKLVDMIFCMNLMIYPEQGRAENDDDEEEEDEDEDDDDDDDDDNDDNDGGHVSC